MTDYTKHYQPGGFQNGSGGSTPVNATVLNEMDAGIDTAHSELDTHKTSSDHDGRYYTEAEVAASYLGVNATAANSDKVDNYHAGTGANTVLLINASGYIDPWLFPKVASDTARNENNNSVDFPTPGGGYTKVKTITLTNGISGSIRVKWHVEFTGTSGYTYDAYSKIYKNGSPIGTQHDLYTGSPGTSNNANYSEDFTLGYCAPGTTIELWGYLQGGSESRHFWNTTFALDYDNAPSVTVPSTGSQP